MAIELEYAAASQEIPLGHFVDESDGKTAETGLTIANTDIKIWKAGATTLANKNSGGATHIAGGVYYCVLDATDTNTEGPLVIFCQVAGALPVRVECNVRPRWWTTQANYWRHVVFFQTTGTPTSTVIRIGTVSYSDIPARTDDDAYIGMTLFHVLDRTNVARVVDYNGTTKDLTIEPALPYTPDSGAYFMLLPAAPGTLVDGAITAAKIADNAIDAGAIAANAITDAKIASDALTAAKFHSDVTTELQSGLATAAALSTVSGLVDDLEGRLTATRAGYLDNLSGGAVALASALSTLSGLVDDLEGRLTATRAGYLDNLNSGVPLTSAAIDAIHDEVVEGAVTLRQAIRLTLSVLTAKSSGGGTSTVVYRDIGDTKNRISATVDGDGNRTAVGTRDGS